ncbi:MAG: hypothetical protein PXX73_05215 [Sideroxydans sp.]|nr:hypothetical protein [Sideroxydans sp.]
MSTSHTWNFFRAGGFDQVQLSSGADLLALKDLDQKLWVALSCPTRGIEFDSDTLDMIDCDGDGKVRANEVLAAITWAGSLLKNADLLVAGQDVLPLHEINDSSDEGRHVLASARHILRSLNKPDALEISLADMHDIERLIASLEFNGDGVVTPEQISDNSLRSTVADAMQCVGSVADLSGAIGINAELNEQFFSELNSYAAWHQTADATVLLLGADTAAAAVALEAVQAKINDYFLRCQLAAYDLRAAEPLSRAVSDYEQLAAEALSSSSTAVANFPLATIAANKDLPLCTGINPSWQVAIAALRNQVVVPLLGDKKTLSASDWATLCAKFSAYASWQAAKPSNCVEGLGLARIDEILHSDAQAKISALIAQDAAVAEEVKAIRSVEKLLRYQRDLFLLTNNFVSFRNFYTGKDRAIFQVGTLFLDGRSCELCIKIDDVAKHAGFAASSGVCLAYCECTRNSGKQKMTVAAAFTAGDSDFLMVGRNGIFYDRKGQDWDAQIVRIIDHPISIRQAFFSPYKKAVKMISAQIQKLAASKANAVDDKLMSSAVEHGKAVVAPAAPPKAAFDVGKFAGIFAAIGLAIGAIGGILASVVAGMLALKIWQMPLALVGLMLMISGPAMLLAWFKLKNRNLAPILDANGWAINARALINIPFGTSLTHMPHLPAGSHRSLVDPFAEKKSLWPFYVVIALGIAALVVLWYYGFFGHRA